MRRVTAACARCGKTRTLSIRDICRSCTVTTGRAGTFHQWPIVRPEPRTLADFAAEFETLDSAGCEYMQICRRMGYSTANNGSTLRAMIVRAQKAGLLKKGRPRCGWRPAVYK